ncbi:MAG TPA: DUF5683 domain-containing protein [Flavitalea sp.]|nr:DUF5683 domain-containing protein [Flavitalea sp.]
MIRVLLTVFICSIALFSFSQKKDSLIVSDSGVVIHSRLSADSMVIRKDSVKKHNPRKATLRSAIIPGWGQVYNKKYWKVPLVYTAIGIPVFTFLDNKKWYNKTRQAAKMIALKDTVDYRNRVDPKLYVFFSTSNSIGSLLNYRNEFRRNMDYSILFFLLFWGLNVVDATVDAHLRGFDISDDLSLKIKPNFDRGAGLSIVLNFK